MLAWICSLLLVLASATAHAQPKRTVALVIGNSAYTNTAKLANPRADATDVAAALKKHGYEVIEGYDLDKTAFDRRIRDFAIALQGADVGMFFYAGHGLQIGGQNFLVPIDAQLVTASALEFEMIRLDLVHRVMEREAKTNILFLDACRDNPLTRNLSRAMGTRSADIGRGLAAVESGIGTLISFSTQPGNVAADGQGKNSPYSGALARHISDTADDLSAILIAVRNDVMKETQRKQVPWEHSALTGRFFFGAPKPSVPEPLLPPPSREPRLLLEDDPATTLLTPKDRENIVTLASKKGLPLPPFTIRTPATDTPQSIRRLVGVWISDEGFINSGRQFMIIFTNADKEGRVVGHVSRGPPQPKSFLREPAATFHTVALIEKGAVRWDNKDSKVSVFLTAQNQLEYKEAFSGGWGATVILKPVWTLVEAERAAKR